MKKRLLSSLAFAAAAVVGSMAIAAPFTPGNLVVTRVGDGVISNSSTAAAPGFIDEYTVGGTATGNVLALPDSSTGVNGLTWVINSPSLGQITRSADGSVVSVYGYDVPIGTSGPNTSTTFTGRTVAVVNQSGAMDTSTRFVRSSNVPRGVYSDGSTVWTVGDGGGAAATRGGIHAMSLGQTDGGTLLLSTTLNMRTVQPYNNQLYIGAATTTGGEFRGVSAVGTGLPTTAPQTLSLLPGMGGTGSTTYDFLFAGNNTVYLCDDGLANAAARGLQKWTFDGATWTKAWNVVPDGANGVRSLAGVTDASGNVSIYGITSVTAANGQTSLFSFSDTLSSVIAPLPTDFVTLATSPVNTVFRGVEFAPIPEPGSLAVAGIAALGVLLRRRK